MGLYEMYQYIVYDSMDPSLKDMYFYSSPLPIITILFLYWYFVRVLGPKIMEVREPYNIKWFISIYNVIQIIWNGYMLIYTIRHIYGEYLDNHPMYGLWCFPTTLTADDHLSKTLFYGAEMYLYNKIFDLSDTIFFVMRKRYKQITYLHLFHHAAMCFGIWLGMRYETGGNVTSLGIFNTTVHVIMYTYYQLSLIGCTKWLWWKKQLTQLQIIQFVSILIYVGSVYFQPGCRYNPLLTLLALFHAVYFIYLFGNYYVRTYVLKKEKKK